jgi:ATP-dependent Lon protease
MLGPLLDRIEIINVPAYLPVEKINIAKNYLIPAFETEYHFGEEHTLMEKIQLTDAALVDMINNYCGFEAGVRNLRKCIDRVFRKIVAKLETKKVEDAEANGIDLSEENNKDAADVGHHLLEDIGKIKQY